MRDVADWDAQLEAAPSMASPPAREARLGPLPKTAVIGGKYAVRTIVASPRSERRYRSFADARTRADQIGGIVVDLTQADKIVYWSPDARQAFTTGRARSW